MFEDPGTYFALVQASVQGTIHRVLKVFKSEVPSPDPDSTAVLITGAGFSKAWGYPLTNEIPRRILEKLRPIPSKDWTTSQALENALLRLPAGNDDFELLLTALKRCTEGHGCGELVALGLSHSGSHSPLLPSHALLYDLLIGGFDRVLNGAHQWVGDEYSDESFRTLTATIVQAETAYQELSQTFGPFGAFVTTNYDMLPEFPFSANMPADYGFPSERVARVVSVATKHTPYDQTYMAVTTAEYNVPKGSVPILKIHGTQNGAYCPTCDKVLLYPDITSESMSIESLVNVSSAWGQTTNHHYSFHCGEPSKFLTDTPSMRPFFLPPIESKNSLPEWEVLTHVRKRAIEVLSRADRAVVIGTNVRPSDEQLRELLALLKGKRVWFIGGPEGYERLRKIVGDGAEYLRSTLAVQPS